MRPVLCFRSGSCTVSHSLSRPTKVVSGSYAWLIAHDVPVFSSPFTLLGRRQLQQSSKAQEIKRISIMSQHPKGQARRSSSQSSSSATSEKKAPMKPRPSSSIILLSPTNEVLLLHRVQTSSSFPSAHVFPGGNLSPFHEPALSSSSPESPEYHQDSLPYRLAAIRETFEESGILLARRRPHASDHNNGDSGPLLTIPEITAAQARTSIHGDQLKFTDWVEGELGARLCTDELVPFTRWITPPWSKGKRFTTQMYLFLMPLSSSSTTTADSTSTGTKTVEIVQTPTSDGGIEHTAATFASPTEWLRRQTDGEIILFPPQCFLLTMVVRAFDRVASLAGRGRAHGGSDNDPQALYAAQRKALLDFITTTASSPTPEGGKVHPTAAIPWTEKSMSPEMIFIRKSDGRLVLGLDKPGLELKGSGRGGDFERVVLVNFKKEGPRNVEVRQRDEVLREEKELEKDGKGPSKL